MAGRNRETTPPFAVSAPLDTLKTRVGQRASEDNKSCSFTKNEKTKQNRRIVFLLYVFLNKGVCTEKSVDSSLGGKKQTNKLTNKHGSLLL